MKEPVSLLDRCFVRVETKTTPQHIAAFSVLSTLPEIGAIKPCFENLLQLFPRLRQRITGSSRLFWENDPEFSLQNHVETIRVPGLTSLDALTQAAAAKFSQAFSFQHPLWRFTLFSPAESTTVPKLPGSEPIAGFLFAMHHALVDGFGGMELIDAITNSDQFGHGTTTNPKALRRASTIVNKYGVNSFRSFTQVAKERFSSHGQSAFTGVNSPRRLIETLEFDFEQLLSLKRRLRVNLNNIFLGIVSYASRLYHQAHRLPLDHLRAIIPVNLRRGDERLSLGNHLSGLGIDLPFNLPSPREQVDYLEQEMQTLYSRGAFGSLLVFAKLSTLLPRFLQQKLLLQQADRSSFICTNVPGSRKPRFFCGARIESTYGLPALMQGHGLGFAFMTYTNKVCVAIVSDPAIVKDPTFLAACLKQAKETLVTEAVLPEGQSPVLKSADCR